MPAPAGLPPATGRGTPTWRPSGTIVALRARAGMLRAAREFFAERQVLEVQTPVLGGHTVTDPAIDSLHVAGADRYLQTSPEYHMKRLLAAGAPSIYQIGPVFRRGEVGRWHNPEFTMIEWYRLGFDAERLMDEVRDLVDALLGAGSWQRSSYLDVLRADFGTAADALFRQPRGDFQAGDEEALRSLGRELGLEDARDAGEVMDLAFDQALASRAPGRLFITEFPAAQAALARLGGDGTAARFELVIDGVEIANGYHELADADELAARLAADNHHRRRRGLATIEADAALLAAQRHGLPDCAGVALGFDRLLALKLGVPSLAETMAFAWGRS